MTDDEYCCFNCDSLGGGYYKPHDGDTVWHIGLDSSGQAHYACAECAPTLFNVSVLHPLELHQRTQQEGKHGT